MDKQRDNSEGEGERGNVEEQLKATNQQLLSSEQQLRAANQQLEAAIGQLRTSEQRYALAQQAANIGTWETNLDTGKVTWAGQTHSLFGFAPDEFEGTRETFYELVYPDDRQFVMSAVEVCIQESKPYRFEHRIIRQDGRLCWVSEMADVFLDPKGEAKRLVGVVVDITKRKKAEEKLRKSEERFRQVVENAREWIWDVDINGLYTYASTAVEKILGYKPEEIVGKKHFYDLFHPDERQQLKKEAFKFFEQKLPFNEFINKNIHKNGGIVWLSTSGVPLVDEQGELWGYRGADEDITERKRAEEKLLEYQQQLKSLASELLLTEERERRHLAIGLHDNIGQNLALTKLAIQSLMESMSDSEVLLSLNTICASIDKTIRDSHSLTFELSNPVLYELGFEAAVEQWMKEQIEEKWGIQCKFKVSGGPFQLDSEISVVLFETVRELLINIVKHAKAETVEVEIEGAGDRIKVIVADDGIGFSSTETSLSSSHNKSGGFGLFSIRERLEYLNGDMEIKSLPGEGTRVILSAPIKR